LATDCLYIENHNFLSENAIHLIKFKDMNGAHWHLLMNHIPIMFPAAGLLVMIMSLLMPGGARFRQAAYFLFIIGAVSAYPAMETGEGAEHVMKSIPGTDKKLIHEHEEMAESLAVVAYILGVLSAICWWAEWKSKAFAKWAYWSTLVTALILLILAYRTGVSGGIIKHQEIRADLQPTGGNETSGEHE